jgi:hypothetical protein
MAKRSYGLLLLARDDIGLKVAKVPKRAVLAVFLALKT